MLHSQLSNCPQTMWPVSFCYTQIFEDQRIQYLPAGIFVLGYAFTARSHIHQISARICEAGMHAELPPCIYVSICVPTHPPTPTPHTPQPLPSTHTDRHTHTETKTRTHTHTETHTHTHPERRARVHTRAFAHTRENTPTQTNKQTNKQVETDRQSARQTDTHTHGVSEDCVWVALLHGYV